MTKVLIPGQNTASQPSGYAALDSAGGLIVPAYLEAAQQGSTPATPVAGKTRLYVDSNGLLQLLPPSGATRRIATHWGSGTAFPAGIAAGDTFLRTDVGTNGTLYQFTGNTSQGSAGWIVEGSAVCTSTTRPTVALYAGLQIYETDTGRTYSWTPALTFGAGQAAALWDQVNGPPETYMPTYSNGATDFVSGTWQPFRINKLGRRCWAVGLYQGGGASATVAINTGIAIATAPAAAMPLAIDKQAVPLWMPNNGYAYLQVDASGVFTFVPVSGAAASGWNAGSVGLTWRTIN